MKEWRKKPGCRFVVFACTKLQKNEKVGYVEDKSLIPFRAYAVATVGSRCVSDNGEKGWTILELRQLWDMKGEAGIVLPKYGRPTSGSFLKPDALLHDELLDACNRTAPVS